MLDNSTFFEKASSNQPAVEGEVFRVDSLNFRILNNTTSYISIPSFYPSEIRSIDSLLRKNDSIIKLKKNLIIDLRNNGGGSIESSNKLIKYLYTNPIQYPEAYNIASDSSISNIEEILSKK